MGTYNIPRNVKGEGKILYVFSTKALIYTFIGAAIGGVLYFILNSIGLGTIGFILVVIFGGIGFCIATFKVPKIKTIKVFNDIGGENIDEVIKRYIKFKSKKNKIYSLYTKEEK